MLYVFGVSFFVLNFECLGLAKGWWWQALDQLVEQGDGVEGYDEWCTQRETGIQ